jgi:hypothetical protein
LQEWRAYGSSGQNTRPSAGLQKVSGSIRPKECLHMSTLPGAVARLGRAPVVRRLSGDADALTGCPNEKDLETRAFSEAADGIRTHDLLHGKQIVGPVHAPNVPAKGILLPREGVPPMSRISREITGISGLKPD